MSTLSPSVQTSNSTPEFPGVLFGRSADGMLVALVGECALAMAPARDGRHYLATGWRIARPMCEWTRDDFYGHGGNLRDDDAFRAKVLEQAEHRQEQAELGRRDIRSPAHTPWGLSQGATVYADGVTFHSTAGHGGFHLSADRNARVYSGLRSAAGFYEEDECWAIVAVTFPDLFTAYERRCAEQTIKDSFPDAWEAISGTVLEPRESWTKDRRAFEAKHANDWIVVSAITSEQHKGFVECLATPGGKRAPGTEERRFLVLSAEYEIGRFGFVVDPDRHVIYNGPSSFVGWQGRAM